MQYSKHRDILNANGDIVNHYDYRPYGALLWSEESIPNPIQYSSEVYDPELGLISYNYRHYNPEDGRWLTRDPIQEDGGLNLYGFVGNNSLLWGDWLGLIDSRSQSHIDKLDPVMQSVVSLCIILTNQALKAQTKPGKTPKTIKIIASYRSIEEQNELYSQGRTKAGKRVTRAKGGQSVHNYALAYDIGVFECDRYCSEGDEYKIAGKIAKMLYLEWGGDFKSIVDEPHFQYPLKEKPASSLLKKYKEARQRGEKGINMPDIFLEKRLEFEEQLKKRYQS